MTALVKSETMPRRGVFARIFRGTRYLTAEQSVLFGMKILNAAVFLPTDADERELAKIRRAVLSGLCENGVGTVCLRGDFPYPDWFRGFRRPDGRSFARRLVAARVCAQSDSANSIAVSAKRIDRTVSDAIRLYCKRFRYVMLTAPCADERAADALSEASGASIIFDPTDRRILTADTAAVYDMPDRPLTLSPDCTVFAAEDAYFSRIIGGIPSRPPALRVPKCDPSACPEGFSAEEILSEAVLRGSVRLSDIEIQLSSLSESLST